MDSDRQPLKGLRVVVTRAPEQAGELAGALERMGAEVLLLPMVRFAPPEDGKALDDALSRLSSFDAILFLSRNAVHYFFDRCEKLGIKFQLLPPASRLIAAVGPATARAVEEEGLRVDYVARNHSGDALVRELRGSISNRNVLLPRSDRGDDRLAGALREAGAQVTEVVAYRTLAPEKLDPGLLDQIRRGEVNVIVFASPSAFHGLRDSIGSSGLAKLGTRIHFAAIGSTTARAVREAGMPCVIEAEEATAPSLAESIARYFEKEPKRR